MNIRVKSINISVISHTNKLNIR